MTLSIACALLAFSLAHGPLGERSSPPPAQAHPRQRRHTARNKPPIQPSRDRRYPAQPPSSTSTSTTATTSTAKGARARVNAATIPTAASSSRLGEIRGPDAASPHASRGASESAPVAHDHAPSAAQTRRHLARNAPLSATKPAPPDAASHAILSHETRWPAAEPAHALTGRGRLGVPPAIPARGSAAASQPAAPGSGAPVSLGQPRGGAASATTSHPVLPSAERERAVFLLLGVNDTPDAPPTESELVPEKDDAFETPPVWAVTLVIGVVVLLCSLVFRRAFKNEEAAAAARVNSGEEAAAEMKEVRVRRDIGSDGASWNMSIPSLSLRPANTERESDVDLLSVFESSTVLPYTSVAHNSVRPPSRGLESTVLSYASSRPSPRGFEASSISPYAPVAQSYRGPELTPLPYASSARPYSRGVEPSTVSPHSPIVQHYQNSARPSSRGFEASAASPPSPIVQNYQNSARPSSRGFEASAVSPRSPLAQNYQNSARPSSRGFEAAVSPLSPVAQNYQNSARPSSRGFEASAVSPRSPLVQNYQHSARPSSRGFEASTAAPYSPAAQNLVRLASHRSVFEVGHT
ncbi:hypothetical protein DIPPA_29458 [Diplonema papillatum]|nr:hypothetical protein DIPPA_29458 [Diplonema papillatum]